MDSQRDSYLEQCSTTPGSSLLYTVQQNWLFNVHWKHWGTMTRMVCLCLCVCVRVGVWIILFTVELNTYNLLAQTLFIFAELWTIFKLMNNVERVQNLLFKLYDKSNRYLNWCSGWNTSILFNVHTTWISPVDNNVDFLFNIPMRKSKLDSKSNLIRLEKKNSVYFQSFTSSPHLTKILVVLCSCCIYTTCAVLLSCSNFL